MTVKPIQGSNFRVTFFKKTKQAVFQRAVQPIFDPSVAYTGLLEPRQPDVAPDEEEPEPEAELPEELEREFPELLPLLLVDPELEPDARVFDRSGTA